ncbi:MAG: NAD(P)/FAD-dependent oxidoreductase [Phycisphaerales bacterium JB040]
MSVSLWQRAGSAGLAPRRAPGETVTCDAAVIGGGITGLTAAIELERRGLSVVVLEACRVAHGASGRNAGFLMRGAADNYAAAIRDWGHERATEIWRWTEENLRALRADGIGSLGSFEDRGSCLVALEEGEEAELRESAELMRADGFEVGLIEASEGRDDVIWSRARPRVGLLNPGDATVSPYELVAWLRGRLAATRVIEGVEIDRIETLDAGRYRLSGGGAVGEVLASRVFVATNAWGSVLVPGLPVEPNRGQMLAARPRDPGVAALSHAYYLNHGAEYVRRGPRGWGEDLVVLGGARKHDEAAERSHGMEPTTPIQSRLEELLRRWVTEEYEIVARWAGTMGFGPRGLPTIRRVGGGDVWYCGGFTGHGMSMAYITSRAAVGAMLDGTPTPFDA